MKLLILVAAVFTAAAAITFYLSRTASRFNVLDTPNPRSLHQHPVPRTGGLAIYLAVLAACALLWPVFHAASLVWYMALVTALSLVALADDYFNLSIATRLAAQVIAAVLLCSQGLLIGPDFLPGLFWRPPQWIAFAATVLYIVWMVNLYNFMDGMDGLAAGMAAIGFLFYALLSAMALDIYLMSLCLVLASASAGFLAFNFPPAKIFMGDVGSVLLGFSLAVVSLLAHQRNTAPLWVGVLIFSPFIMDATVTVLRRAATAERFWRPHKSHYYQVLVQSFGHRRTVLMEYALMFLVGASAVVAAHSATPVQQAVLCFWAAAYITLMLGIEIKYRKRAGAA